MFRLESLQPEQWRRVYSCIYLSVPFCFKEALRCSLSPILFLSEGPDRDVRCWMFAVCRCIVTRCFAMYPFFLNESDSARISFTATSLCCHCVSVLPAASHRPMKVSLAALCSSVVLFLSLHHSFYSFLSLSSPLGIWSCFYVIFFNITHLNALSVTCT